jgi:DNA-binding SARP family transcriptional activator
VAVLQLLGGLALQPASGDTPIRLQPRRQALLAVIAASDTGIRRDVAMARLWPESTDTAARNALKQALFGIRAALPEGALQGRDTLFLDRSLVSVDRADFLNALAVGDHLGAVQAYRGRFLDGVHVSDAPDFENWAASEAHRLSRLHADALEVLVQDALKRKDSTDAVRWLRIRVETSPLESTPVLQLMQLQVAAGDSPAALGTARTHERALLRELDAVPDAAVLELVRKIRWGPMPEGQWLR